MEHFVPAHELENRRHLILEAIKYFLQETNNPQHTCLLICPCYELHMTRCNHLISNHTHPFIPLPFCLRAGELNWFELTQPFYDEYGVNLLWRCENVSCRREYCCGFAQVVKLVCSNSLVILRQVVNLIRYRHVEKYLKSQVNWLMQ